MELQSSLAHLRNEYVATIRKLAENARAKRFDALRDAIKDIDPNIQPDLQQEMLEVLEDQTDIRKVFFQSIKNKIRTTNTRYTATTAYRAIEETLAKPWLSSGAGIKLDVLDGPSDKDEAKSPVAPEDEDMEDSMRRDLDELGFMLRAPISAIAAISFVFGSPFWPWIIHKRSYHLSMDIIHSRYQEEIVAPWMRDMQDEGERSLLGTISKSSEVAKEAVEGALRREEERYEREKESKSKPVPPGTIQHLVAVHGNLLAAEGALTQLGEKVRELSLPSLVPM